MAQITSITGAAWPTSGNATAATTGLHSITAGTHVIPDSLPPGSSSASAVQWASGAAATIKIDNPTATFAGSKTHYYLRSWVRPLVADYSALPTNGTVGYPCILSAGATNRLRIRGMLNNNASYNAGLLVDTTRVGFSVGDEERLYTATSYEPTIGFNAWSEIVIHIEYAASAVCEIFVNGTLVCRRVGLPVSSEMSLAELQQCTYLTLPAYTGIQWQLAGPIASWDDVDISIRPNYDLFTSADAITKSMTCRFVNCIHGGYWQSSGTATVTPTTYCTSGQNPYRSRYVMTGSANDTVVLTSYDAIGTLPFNSQGWATVVFPASYLPSGATLALKLRNAANDADVIAITFDGTNITNGGTTLVASYDATKRWAVAIHLHEDGDAAYTIIDQTTSPATGRIVWSGALPNWTPQAVGVAVQTAVLGSAGAELDGLQVCRWLEIAAMDSLCGGTSPNVSPGVRTTGARIARYFGHSEAASSVPGGPYPLRVLGHYRHSFTVLASEEGLTRALWTANAGQYFTGSRGIRIVEFDGPSVNDNGNIYDAATKTTIVNSLKTNFRSVLHAAVANGNEYWATTTIRREISGTTYSAYQLQALSEWNYWIRQICYEEQTAEDLIYISDVAAETAQHFTLFTSSDYTHMTDAACLSIAAQMVAIRTLVPQVEDSVAGTRITAAAEASQLATDVAAVNAKKQYVVVGQTLLGVSGEYPTTATSKAEQLATDQATAEAHEDDIRYGVSFLGTTGTLELPNEGAEATDTERAYGDAKLIATSAVYDSNGSSSGDAVLTGAEVTAAMELALVTLADNVGDVLTRMGTPSTGTLASQVEAALADTNELQTLFKDGGDADAAEMAADAEAARAQIALVDARLPATPAAKGDAMALTSVERTTLAAAVWNALISTLTTASSIGKLLLDKLTPLPYAVLPYASSASNDGHLDPIYLTGYQGCKILASFAVTDAADEPVDLSGMSLSLVAWPANAPTTAGFELLNTGTSPSLTVSGDDNSQVNVDVSATNTATAGDFDWTLYDTSNDVALANGTLRIIAGRVPSST